MVNSNGKLFENSLSAIDLDNRGLNYGDALFETMRVINGRIVFWSDHHARLVRSMKLLRMEIPKCFSKDNLQAEILETLGDNTTSPHRVKLLVWRKAGGKYGPKNNEVEFAISYELLSNSNYVLNTGNYKIELYTEFRMYSGALSTLKTNNKIINVVGSIYAQENNLENCLLLNEKGNIVEALNGNVFLVFGNRIKTPTISEGCLQGVLRKQLLDLLDTHSDFSIEEVAINPNMVSGADEVLITNVISGISAVSKYGEIHYKNETAKRLLELLNARVAQIN